MRQRADAQTLVELLGRMTGEPPVLWGSMVDFGRYHYKYASGREGDALPYRLFAAQERVQHLTELSRCAGECRGACRPVRLRSQAPLGRGCLYVKRLTDVDLNVLEDLTRMSIAMIGRMYRGT